MTYYKVTEYKDVTFSDSKIGHSITHTFVQDELYTKTELEKFFIDTNNLPDFIKEVNVSKRKLYWFFGARFEA